MRINSSDKSMPSPRTSGRDSTLSFALSKTTGDTKNKGYMFPFDKPKRLDSLFWLSASLLLLVFLRQAFIIYHGNLIKANNSGTSPVTLVQTPGSSPLYNPPGTISPSSMATAGIRSPRFIPPHQKHDPGSPDRQGLELCKLRAKKRK